MTSFFENLSTRPPSPEADTFSEVGLRGCQVEMGAVCRFLVVLNIVKGCNVERYLSRRVSDCGSRCLSW